MSKLAVITGASRGLGRSLVQEFAACGWDVIAITKSPWAGVDQPGAKAVSLAQWDVRAEPSEELADAVDGRPVDLIINNAAEGAPHAPLGSIDPERVLNSVDVNVAGPLRLVQFLLSNLFAAHDPIIVNVTSRLGSLSAQADGDFAELSTSYAYKISKAAQNMLTVSLAQDLQGKVRCWAVHPGKLTTGMGQVDASKKPCTAARELRELVDSSDRTSPRFCSLGEQDLSW
ncbi:SDR family NAD(P)-dependent oxidoreductase [Arthrobacter sp. KFRI-F3372]|uniref:SDR family NAD(P)-dependent oxidoreductase n=1 Tax=Pseudarthrobacter oxydans TaxID=1671 RepID=UPI0027991BF7|nr:SDR family NAD(P)-dependent oxidoreductase [Arthrobacter sp. KFRI-F3372]